MDRKHIVRSGYDKAAPAYTQHRLANVEPDVTGLIRELFESLPAGSRALDAGCGGGVIAALMASHFDVYGVDMSIEQLRLARTIAPKTRLFCQDITTLSPPDGFFDLVCCLWTIVHVPREEHLGLLKLLRRALSPGGLAFLSFGQTEWGGPSPSSARSCGGRTSTARRRSVSSRNPDSKSCASSTWTIVRATSARRLSSLAAVDFQPHPTIVNQMVKSQVLDRTFSALADPTRRDILDRLGRGPASISDLARPLGISLPGLMKHVRILEEAELVATQKKGRTRECALGPAQLDDVSEWVDAYRRRWERRIDRLEAYIAKKKEEKR